MKFQISGDGFLADIERLLNEVCGETEGSEQLKRLCEYYQGVKIEVPSMTKVYRQSRDEEIRKGFIGDNYLELAEEWGMTRRQVRNIIKGED